MIGKIKRISLLCLFLLSSSVYGEVAEENSYEEPLYVYEFPVISPEINIKAGYSFLERKGSKRAGEFYYPHSSVSGGFFLKAFPFPHRVHLEFEALNKKDYFGDIRYAYKDIALLRVLTRGIYHNLDNKTLIDAGPSPQYTVEQRDKGKEYEISNNISNLYLRLKTPDYPFHIFADAHVVRSEGSMQQRFLSSYLPLNRVSMHRDLDWYSQAINIGTNSHLGPVEIELSRSERRVDVKGDRFFENSYGGNIYPHNLIPELKGSTTTFKIHTSYTGQIVASATLSRTEKENEVSSAKSDYFVAAGDFTYMPDPVFTVFLRYRHRKAESDNPDYIPVNYLGYSAYSSTISVKPSIDSVSDTITGTIRYRMIKGLTLYAEYAGEKIERSNADKWKISSETVKNTLSFTTHVRPVNNIELKAKYIRQNIDSPAYNNEPDTSDEIRLSVNWSPTKRINGLLMYALTSQKREEINFTDNSINIRIGDRKVRREKIFGSLTFLLINDLTVTPNFAFLRNRTRQTIIYDSISSPPDYYVDSDVLYRDGALIYGLNFNYIPK
ncbi:MAG: MtrB/PioB family outer membrane beta-barrel protein, partial [Thermodesulfovibrionales bacterium]|nr:MtrB/PioB family outer membrane beta-barrel protein [Thermodesulfovibrionales bacterium]